MLHDSGLHQQPVSTGKIVTAPFGHLLKQVHGHERSQDNPIIIELHIKMLAKTATIIVPHSFGIPKRLKQCHRVKSLKLCIPSHITSRTGLVSSNLFATSLTTRFPLVALTSER